MFENTEKSIFVFLSDPPRSRVEPAEEGEDEEDDKLTGPDRVTAKVLGQQSARDGQ